MPFLFLFLEVTRTDPWDASLENQISEPRPPGIELARVLFKAFLCACFNFDARTGVHLDAF